MKPLQIEHTPDGPRVSLAEAEYLNAVEPATYCSGAEVDGGSEELLADAVAAVNEINRRLRQAHDAFILRDWHGAKREVERIPGLAQRATDVLALAEDRSITARRARENEHGDRYSVQQRPDRWEQ